MAKQIQLRRGSTAEHENFIGAAGEVTVDTDLNTLRVHDGTTQGGTILAKKSEIPSDIGAADYVIASQTPTAANNYTWYRKYKSGWVEQGGIIPCAAAIGDTTTFNIPIKMQTGYTYQVTAFKNASSWNGNTGNAGIYVRDIQQTFIRTKLLNSTGDICDKISFYVCGFAA